MASKVTSFMSKVAEELGVYSIAKSSRDTKLLCLQRFIRLWAYGATTLILALFLSSLGISDARIGLFMTLTLLGDVVISFVLTLIADGLGRRRILMLGAALMSASGVIFAISGNYWVLVAASIFGVISPSGNEIGPFRAVEESTLAQLTAKEIRSDIFAWYTLLGNAGTACGSVVAGWIVQALLGEGGWVETSAYRAIFGIYAVLGLIKLIFAFMLSDKCEPEMSTQEYQEVRQMTDDMEPDDASLGEEDGQEEHVPSKARAQLPEMKRKSIWPTISPASRSILIKLCLLFAFDSLASGLVPNSWVSYFYNRKFNISEGQLGTLFFATNIISSFSNLAASSLAKRIGLIKTMVFSHLPGSIFLSLIPFPSHAWLSIVFLALRSSLSKMDQAPRQAFLSAVVLPSERTAIMGVVNVVKTLSQSVGPVVTGWLAGIGKFWIAFLVAGAMKIVYDLTMLKMFLGFKSREEEEENRNKRNPEGNGDVA